MKKHFAKSAAIILSGGLCWGGNLGVWAQNAAAKTASGLWQTGAAKPEVVTPTDEMIMQLPASDIVAAIDVKRVMGDLLPRLKAISAGGIGKTASEIESFAKVSGIDPAQVQAAVLGVKMTETLSRGSGVLLLQGVTVDVQKIAANAKAAGGELKSADYQGKALHTLVLKDKPDAPGSEVYFAVLDNQRIAIGDLTAVQSVLASKNVTANHGALVTALKETKSSGLVRFAGNLPEALRAMLAGQGDLFAQVAAVKAIFGSLDLNADNTATVAARARTASPKDAGALKESLGGLVELGKALLGGDDPKMKLYSSLLDKVQIAVQSQDVALTLVLPKELIAP